MDRDKLHRLLRLGIEKGASDIHFQVGYLPLYRFNGDLVELRYKVLTPSDTEAIARILLETDARQEALEWNELDLAYELPGEGRFRVNISRQRRFYNVVLRVIPPQVRSFEELNLPGVLRDIAQLTRGFVLVTGATGQGKSTTLATMIQEVNCTRKAKIVTVEDPIEFVFTHDKSIITQREVGTDTKSFPEALRAALRQDPDVIMVGEMRDLETVDTSLKAAETGHLVFSTIHTNDVTSTVNRLVSFFPTEEQLQVRARLAENLKAVVSLRLLVNKKESGRVPAIEVMRTTRSIQECIKDPARTAELVDFMGAGAANACRPSTSTCSISFAPTRSRSRRR
jgi:twitching motility protein PilT